MTEGDGNEGGSVAASIGHLAVQVESCRKRLEEAKRQKQIASSAECGALNDFNEAVRKFKAEASKIVPAGER